MHVSDNTSPTYRAILWLLAAFPVMLVMLAVWKPERVTHPEALLWNCGATVGIVLLLACVSPLLRERFRAFLIGGGIVFALSLLFDASASVHHVLVQEWKDADLIALDKALFGEELSVLAQRLVHPIVTEWLMAAYVLYVPLLPATAYVCYRHGGRRAMEEYLLQLLLVNICCGIGFIVYPVASQMYFGEAEYTVALHGGLFTAVGEWIRANVHFPGGSLPSPHCAAGTVMLVHLLRNSRRMGLIAVPVLTSIPAATVYCRFHYMWDGVAGVVLAAVVIVLAPHFAAQHTFLQRVPRRSQPSRIINPEGGVS